MMSNWKIAAYTCILGLSLSPTLSHAHPTTAAISTGTNPIVNVAGQRREYGLFEIIAAPEGQDIVITDVVFSADSSGAGEPMLKLGSGAVVGRYFIFGGTYHGGGPAHFALQTGIRIPAGDTLLMETNTSNAINYSFSGYYAQP